MSSPHPWRDLRLLGVTLEWRQLNGCLGETDGRRRIWLDPRQDQAERRCTLAHELEHLRREHTGPVSDQEEASVRQAVARYLIDLGALADGLMWSFDEVDLADELFVDVATVRDRLAGLTQDEQSAIETAIRDREGAA